MDKTVFDFKTVLSEAEQNALTKVADLPEAVSALKKVILADVYYNGVMTPGEDPVSNRNFFLKIISNTPTEDLAATMVAVFNAVNIVEGGFKKIEEFKSAEIVSENNTNEAR